MKVTLETLATDIGYIKDGFDEFKKFTKEQFENVINRQDKTNGRVRALEKFRWFIAGGMAVITILVIPIVINVVSDWATSRSQVYASTK